MCIKEKLTSPIHIFSDRQSRNKKCKTVRYIEVITTRKYVHRFSIFPVTNVCCQVRTFFISWRNIALVNCAAYAAAGRQAGRLMTPRHNAASLVSVFAGMGAVANLTTVLPIGTPKCTPAAGMGMPHKDMVPSHQHSVVKAAWPVPLPRVHFFNGFLIKNGAYLWQDGFR